MTGCPDDLRAACRARSAPPGEPAPRWGPRARAPIPAVAAVVCLLGWGGDSGGNNGPDAILTLAPGEDWQARVDAAPAGAVFTVKAGVHRLQTVTPKSDLQFLAEPGAVMSGAKLLDDWVQSGATWYVDGQTQEFGHDVGVCAPGKACQYPEDVYRDDVLLHRELSLAAVGPGDFYFDYAADRIYVGDDPVGHRLEAAATEYASWGVRKEPAPGW